MARWTRLAVLNASVETGLAPVLNHADVEMSRKVAHAFSEGGCHLLEFTQRDDQSPQILTSLSQYVTEPLPNPFSMSKAAQRRRNPPRGGQASE